MPSTFSVQFSPQALVSLSASPEHPEMEQTCSQTASGAWGLKGLPSLCGAGPQALPGQCLWLLSLRPMAGQPLLWQRDLFFKSSLTKQVHSPQGIMYVWLENSSFACRLESTFCSLRFTGTPCSRHRMVPAPPPACAENSMFPSPATQGAGCGKGARSNKEELTISWAGWEGTQRGRDSFCSRAVPRHGTVLDPTGNTVAEEAGGGQGELNSEWFSRDGRIGLVSSPEAATQQNTSLLLLWHKTSVTPEGKTLFVAAWASLLAKLVSSKLSKPTVPTSFLPWLRPSPHGCRQVPSLQKLCSHHPQNLSSRKPP